MKTLYRVRTNDYSVGEYLVFANSYNEAARKAEDHYITSKIDEQESESILNSDGDLSFLHPKRKEKDFSVRSVEVVDSIVIM